MKFTYHKGPSMPVRIKSKKDFFIYYFNNLMACTDDVEVLDEKVRIKDMLEITRTYKIIFRLGANFSTVKLWSRMKKYYLDNWDELMWLNLELERGNVSLPISKCKNTDYELKYIKTK